MLANPRNYFLWWGVAGAGGGEESRNPGIWNPKSHGRLKSGIQVPLTKIWNKVQSTAGTRNPRSGIQNTRLHWIPCLMGLIEGPINNRRKSKTVVITCQLKIKKKTEPSVWHPVFKANNCVCNHSR